MPTSIRIISIVTAVVATIVYPIMLFLVTYGYCYMDDASCSAGQTARTVVPGIYLAVVAIVVGLTKWGLRKACLKTSNSRASLWV